MHEAQIILNAIAGAAAALVPIGPLAGPATLVGIGATLVGNVMTALAASGVKLVDENGNPITLEEMSARVQAEWDKAAIIAATGSARAQEQIDRTE